MIRGAGLVPPPPNAPASLAEAEREGGRPVATGAMLRHATFLTATAIFAIVLAVCAAAQAPVGRASSAPSVRPSQLPPVLQTCPMHPDVVEDKPGTCPLCRMALVPVRLESVWSCPVHSAIQRSSKGVCPICGRQLVQMTMALTWTCKGRPDIDVIEPARCPDGSAMVAKRTLRPHGNHNPQHGGQFFMAPDNSHHLEGTLPSARLFRVYMYDDYARPLAAARMKDVRGRVEIDGRAIPLKSAATGSYLEARIDGVAFPARMTARLQIKPDAPEYGFDFAFPAVTKDPDASIVSRGRGAGTGAASAPVTPPATLANPDAPDPALIQIPIPGTVPEILTQIRTRDRQVLDLINRGNLPAVFVPAFQARDLAIALESRLDTLTGTAREPAAAAIVRLVRAAWRLDSAGDIGNRDQSLAAHAELHAAALAIEAAFSGSR